MGLSKDQEQSLALRLGLTAVSAMASEAATFPIDITKTRLQLQGEMSGATQGGAKRGAISMAMAIGREEGISGLYRGLSPALLRHVFYSSIRIVAYENLRKSLSNGEDSQNLSVTKSALIGGASGIIGQVIASPADLVKVRMQLDGRLIKLGHTPRYTGVTDAFAKIVQAEGVKGLWRGVGPNAQRAFLVNMGELACYDQSKQWVIRQGIAGDNIGGHILASAMSGLSATILSCPADVVKTRMMNQESGGSVYRSSLDCLVKTVKGEGVMALWKGFIPTWTRLAPWQLVFWVSYEQLRKISGLSSF